MKLTCQNQHCKDYAKEDGSNLIKYGKDRHSVQRYLCRTCNRTFTLPELPKLQPWQRKKPQNIKSQRGQPELYDQVKKKVTISLTPKAVNGLDNLAMSLNISRSELIEQIGRGLILIKTTIEE